MRLDSRGTRIFADLLTPFGLQLYRYGYDEPEALLVQSLLRPGDVFIDGGAHIGLFSLLAAACVGNTGRVIACEPVPENVKLLKANIDMNRFTWVDVQKAALAEAAGEAVLFSFGEASAVSSFAPATTAGSSPITTIVTSLDVIAPEVLSRLRVIKLDIEGAEVRALRGAQTVLQCHPDFLIEVEPDHLDRQGTSVDELESMFLEAGYRGYELRKQKDAVGLVPLARWRKRTSGPNLFVSARDPSLFPPPVRVQSF